MDGWNTHFLLGPGLFSGAWAVAVSFREGTTWKYHDMESNKCDGFWMVLVSHRVIGYGIFTYI